VKPSSHCPFVAGRLATADAVTAPASSGVPRAVTHCPTARSRAAPGTVRVHVVADVVLTVTGAVEGVAVDPAPDATAATVSVPPATAVTRPATGRCPPMPLPLAPGPRPPGGAPVGRVLGAPDGRPPGAPGPPTRTCAQEPSTAAVTSTDSAVTAVAGAAGAAVVPSATGRTVTQLPTFATVAAAATVRVNRVLGVQVTATWPLCCDCTCMVRPEIAATRPRAPGRTAPAPGRPWAPAVAVGIGASADVTAPDGLLHPARTTRMTAAPAARRGIRTGRRTGDQGMGISLSEVVIGALTRCAAHR
jgi:hypothetical protein